MNKQDETDEIMADIRMEEIREEAREIREEPMHIWFKENLSSLTEDFAKEHEEEFQEFCIETFNEVMDTQ